MVIAIIGIKMMIEMKTRTIIKIKECERDVKDEMTILITIENK